MNGVINESESNEFNQGLIIQVNKVKLIFSTDKLGKKIMYHIRKSALSSSTIPASSKFNPSAISQNTYKLFHLKIKSNLCTYIIA